MAQTTDDHKQAPDPSEGNNAPKTPEPAPVADGSLPHESSSTAEEEEPGSPPEEVEKKLLPPKWAQPTPKPETQAAELDEQTSPAQSEPSESAPLEPERPQPEPVEVGAEHQAVVGPSEPEESGAEEPEPVEAGTDQQASVDPREPEESSAEEPVSEPLSNPSEDEELSGSTVLYDSITPPPPKTSLLQQRVDTLWAKLNALRGALIDTVDQLADHRHALANHDLAAVDHTMAALNQRVLTQHQDLSRPLLALRRTLVEQLQAKQAALDGDTIPQLRASQEASILPAVSVVKPSRIAAWHAEQRGLHRSWCTAKKLGSKSSIILFATGPSASIRNINLASIALGAAHTGWMGLRSKTTGPNLLSLVGGTLYDFGGAKCATDALTLRFTEDSLHLCAAGYPTLLVKREADILALRFKPAPRLGVDAHHRYFEMEFAIKPSDQLLVCGDGLLQSIDLDGQPLGPHRLMEAFGDCTGTCTEVMAQLKDKISLTCPNPGGSLLVIDQLSA